MKKVRNRAFLKSIFLFITGVLIGATGIYIGDSDDAPGAALMGTLLMISLVLVSVRSMWRNR